MRYLAFLAIGLLAATAYGASAAGLSRRGHADSSSLHRTSIGEGTIPVTPFDIFDVGLVSKSEGWAVNGLDFDLTRDGGARWLRLSPPGLEGDLATSLGAVASVGENDLWIATIGGEQLGTCGHFESPAKPGTPVYTTGTIDRSTDAGRTWASAKVPHCGFITSLSFPHVTTGFGIGPADQQKWDPGHGLLYRTADGGRTWSIVGPTPFGGAEDLPTGGSAIDFPSRQEGFATSSHDTTPGYLYRTKNGGSAWRRVALPIPRGDIATSAVFGEPQFFSADVGVVPALIERTGTGAGRSFVVFTTSDGGTSWKAVVAPSDARLRAYATSGSVPFSATGAASWFVFVGPKMYVTADAGRRWTTLVPFSRWTAGSVFQIDFVSNKVGWLIANSNGPDGSFVLTTDGGRTWKHLGNT